MKVISNRLREYICSEIIKCILVLHSLQFAHLDIKPDNFIVNDDFSISFIDFGFTQPFAELVRGQVGTKSYLAPEFSEKNSEISGEKADIYALSLTLNKCLTALNPSLSEMADSQELKNMLNLMKSKHQKNRPSMRQIMKRGVFSTFLLIPRESVENEMMSILN